MLELTFKQTPAELMVRAASSLLFSTLTRGGAEEVAVADLAEHPQYGFTASATSQPAGPKFVRITDLQDGQIDWERVPFCECEHPDKYTLRENDILFARTGATTGKTHFVRNPNPAVFASYLIRLRPKANTEASYLYAFFQSDAYWSQILDEKEGSAQPNVNGGKLSALRIPLVPQRIQQAVAHFLQCVRQKEDGAPGELPELPEPLTSQRRVVVCIQDLAAKIRSAQALRKQSIEEADALGAALAHKLFGEVSNSVRIQDIAEVRGGIQKGPHRVPGANPVRYLTVAHVQRNRILTGDPRFFEVTAAEFDRWRLIAGDVLIIEGNGSAEQIGRTAHFRGEIEHCVHQNHVIRMRPQGDKMVADYLNAFLNSPAGQDAVQAQSRTTSGLRTLSVGRIKQIRVPFPPIQEQMQIVAALETQKQQVTALRASQLEAAADLDALLPSLISKAFARELY